MRRKSLEHLRAYVETAQSRSLLGRAVLRALLEQRGDDEALSESEAESIFARALRKGKLPIGQRQAEQPGVRNGRVDFFYPEQNFVIEIDGRKFHSGRREVKRDKRYDNELNIGGKRVLRLTHDDLVHDEDYTLDVVARALGIQRLWWSALSASAAFGAPSSRLASLTGLDRVGPGRASRDGGRVSAAFGAHTRAVWHHSPGLGAGEGAGGVGRVRAAPRQLRQPG